MNKPIIQSYICSVLLTLASLCGQLCGIDHASTEAQTDYVYIFAHGLGSNRNHVKPYQQYGIIPANYTTLSEDGPEVAAGIKQSCLGQEGDVNVIIKQVEQACNANPNYKIIGVGVSKGAATWVNTYGKLAQDKSPYLNNIKALVIESSFTQAKDVALNFFPKVMQWTSSSCMNSLVSWQYPNFNPDGMHPITSVKAWAAGNKETVIILIHSRADKLIPFDHSQQLYKEITLAGFNNLYFLEAQAGEHANVFWGPDGQRVLNQLWAVYRKHGLPVPGITTDEDLGFGCC